MNGAESLVRTWSGGVTCCRQSRHPEMHIVAALTGGACAACRSFRGVVTGAADGYSHESTPASTAAASGTGARQRLAICTTPRRRIRHCHIVRPACRLSHWIQRTADLRHRGPGAADSAWVRTSRTPISRQGRRCRYCRGQEQPAQDRHADPGPPTAHERADGIAPGPRVNPTRQLFRRKPSTTPRRPARGAQTLLLLTQRAESRGCAGSAIAADRLQGAGRLTIHGMAGGAGRVSDRPDSLCDRGWRLRS